MRAQVTASGTTALAPHAGAAADGLFEAADANRDGRLDRTEFDKFLAGIKGATYVAEGAGAAAVERLGATSRTAMHDHVHVYRHSDDHG
jgi:hypothetical protein